jgi:endoglucanase
MRAESLVFLRELLSTPSPSGFERKGQRVWLDYAGQFADETSSDTYGNCQAILNPGGDPKVMIVGHADEIGLMVTHIAKEGFIHVQQIGGIDPAVVVGKRVVIHTAKGPVHGVTGATAIHLQDPKERAEAKVRKLHELFVDIGAKDRKDAEKRVAIGDPATFADDFQLLDGKNIAVARALDNRIGTWVAAETLRLVKTSKRKPSCAIHAASCVQEEVGLRGSHMLAVQEKPDIALVVDVGHATDTPGIDQRMHGKTELGKGPLISIGSTMLTELTDHIERIAAAKRIPLQRVAEPGYSGTDTESVFKVSGGAASALMALPIRYMHTTVELCDLRDLEKIAQVFADVCLSLKKGHRFKAKI